MSNTDLDIDRVQLGLDDTLHAVVQVTHEYGLPLRGADVHPGRVQVFTDADQDRCWVRWLADPATRNARFVVWAKGSAVAFLASGQRAGIDWTVIPTIFTPRATAVLAAHGVTVTEEHVAVPAAVAVALTEADPDTGERAA